MDMRNFDQLLINIFHGILYDLQDYYKLWNPICFIKFEFVMFD